MNRWLFFRRVMLGSPRVNYALMVAGFPDIESKLIQRSEVLLASIELVTTTGMYQRRSVDQICQNLRAELLMKELKVDNLAALEAAYVTYLRALMGQVDALENFLVFYYFGSRLGEKRDWKLAGESAELLARGLLSICKASPVRKILHDRQALFEFLNEKLTEELSDLTATSRAIGLPIFQPFSVVFLDYIAEAALLWELCAAEST